MTDISHPAPIFHSIFGDTWNQLPPVMHKHYANRPFTNDVVTVSGTMFIKMSWLMKLLTPLLRLTKTLVAKEGESIEVKVRFESAPDTDNFTLNRTFRFADGKTLQFVSKLEPIGGNEMIEWTGSGIGWRASYSFENDRVKLCHRGYCIKLFGTNIPLPVSLLFGKGHAEEQAISENSFKMEMHIQHPLWGKLYTYGGTFDVTEMALNE
jgi:hypothetical protein